MKKVLVAMEQPLLCSKLKKEPNYICHEQDINYSEGVIDYLCNNIVDVVITKDTLKGDLTKEEYVRQLNKNSNGARIIMFVDKLSIEYKQMLFANEIFDIIEKETNFEEVKRIIEKEDKTPSVQTAQCEQYKTVEEGGVDVITKQRISVFGTSGAGKSYVASVLGQMFSKKLKMNTLLIDMDVQNAALDIYNNIVDSNNMLYGVMESIEREIFDASLLKQTAIKQRDNAKLSYVTNNMGIYECQTKLSKQYYEKLYNDASNEYDVTIIDLPGTVFLDVVYHSLAKSDKVIFVLNPNFISIRQAAKYLDLIVNVWHIPKERVKLIVNKNKNESLGIKQIESMLKEFEIALTIDDTPYVEEVINGMEQLNIDNIKDMSKIAEFIGLNKSNINENKNKIYSRIQKVLGVRT